MAKKDIKSSDTSDKPTVVTRLKARDDKKQINKQRPVTVNGQTNEKRKNFLLRFLGYFKGAWFELRQVRWPNRRATIGMTTALLLFTVIFAAFILIVDLAFENLFKLIIG